MKVHQMLVQEIVRNLEFRKEFISELEKFAEIAIEFHEPPAEEALAPAIETFSNEANDCFSGMETGWVRVLPGMLIIEGDQFRRFSLEWTNCVSMVGDTVAEDGEVRRPYRPRYGWRMQEGWRELSEQEPLQEGDEINSVSNAGDYQDEGWIYSSRANLGKLYSELNMVARRRIA